MRRPITALAAVLASLAACAGTPGSDPSEGVGSRATGNKAWAKIDGSYAAYGDFERAEAACGHKGGLPDVAAAPESDGDYHACMREQGWALVSIE